MSRPQALPSPKLSARYAALCGLVIATCSIPVLFNTHPPLYDYPIYIARLFILNEMSNNQFISENYIISSFIIPNIAMEILIMPMLQFLSYESAFDIFIVLVITSMVTGTVFLQKVLFDRYNIWPLIAGVFVVNWIFLFGFLTYLLGVGFFLWGIAAWISLSCKSSRYRVLYGSLIAIGLFFTHLVAFGLYAVAVFGFELQRALMSMRGGDGRSPLSAVGTMAFSGIQFVVPVVLYFLSPTRNTGLVEGVDGSIHYEFAKKLATPLVTLTSGIPWLDILLGVTVLVSALLVLFHARFRLSADLVGPAMCMILAFLALPHIMRPAAFVDSRIPIAILFFLIGGVQISFRKGSAGVALMVIISSFFVVKTAAVTKEWWEHDALINEYFDAFDRMEDSGTMFAAMQDVAPSWTRKHYLWRVTSPMHVADLATLTGRVFAPTVFAVSGQHTIAVRERFAEMTAYQSVEPIRFGNPEELTRVIEDLLDLHLQASPDRPAYLLLLDRGRVPMPLVDGSRLIASGRGFRLIQIYEPGDGQGSPPAGRRG